LRNVIEVIPGLFPCVFATVLPHSGHVLILAQKDLLYPVDDVAAGLEHVEDTEDIGSEPENL